MADLRDHLRLADVRRMDSEQPYFWIDRDFRRNDDQANFQIERAFVEWLGDRKSDLYDFDSETCSLVIFTHDDSAAARDALIALIDLWNEWANEGGLSAGLT